MSAPAWRWWWGLSSEEAVESVWTTGLSCLLSQGLPERVEVCACLRAYKEEEPQPRAGAARTVFLLHLASSLHPNPGLLRSCAPAPLSLCP